MRWYYKLSLRLRSLFRKQDADRELDDEIESHLQYQIDENIANGMPPHEARYAALRSLGGVTQIKEDCRDMRRVNFFDNVGQDLRFGFRMLWRNPGFSAWRCFVSPSESALTPRCSVGSKAFCYVHSRPWHVRTGSSLCLEPIARRATKGPADRS